MSKNIGLALLRYTIGLKNSRHFFFQSEVKPKPIATRLPAFSRAFRQLRVITSSFVIILFIVGFTTFDRKLLYQQVKQHVLTCVGYF